MQLKGLGLTTSLTLSDRDETEKADAGASGLTSHFALLLHAHYSEAAWPPLPYVLSMSSRFRPTDPRDRIFALRNISDVEENELVPDYDEPVEVVYRGATACMIGRTALSFPALYMAGIIYHRNLQKLHTRVPDWSTMIPAMSFGCTADRAVTKGFDEEIFYACGKSFALACEPSYPSPESVRLVGRTLDKSYHTTALARD